MEPKTQTMENSKPYGGITISNFANDIGNNNGRNAGRSAGKGAGSGNGIGCSANTKYGNDDSKKLSQLTKKYNQLFSEYDNVKNALGQFGLDPKKLSKMANNDISDVVTEDPIDKENLDSAKQPGYTGSEPEVEEPKPPLRVIREEDDTPDVETVDAERIPEPPYTPDVETVDAERVPEPPYTPDVEPVETRTTTTPEDVYIPEEEETPIPQDVIEDGRRQLAGENEDFYNESGNDVPGGETASETLLRRLGERETQPKKPFYKRLSTYLIGGALVAGIWAFTGEDENNSNQIKDPTGIEYKVQEKDVEQTSLNQNYRTQDKPPSTDSKKEVYVENTTPIKPKVDSQTPKNKDVEEKPAKDLAEAVKETYKPKTVEDKKVKTPVTPIAKVKDKPTESLTKLTSKKPKNDENNKFAKEDDYFNQIKDHYEKVPEEKLETLSRALDKMHKNGYRNDKFDEVKNKLEQKIQAYQNRQKQKDSEKLPTATYDTRLYSHKKPGILGGFGPFGGTYELESKIIKNFNEAEDESRNPKQRIKDAKTAITCLTALRKKTEKKETIESKAAKLAKIDSCKERMEYVLADLSGKKVQKKNVFGRMFGSKDKKQDEKATLDARVAKEAPRSMPVQSKYNTRIFPNKKSNGLSKIPIFGILPCARGTYEAETTAMKNVPEAEDVSRSKSQRKKDAKTALGALNYMLKKAEKKGNKSAAEKVKGRIDQMNNVLEQLEGKTTNTTKKPRVEVNYHSEKSDSKKSEKANDSYANMSKGYDAPVFPNKKASMFGGTAKLEKLAMKNYNESLDTQRSVKKRIADAEWANRYISDIVKRNDDASAEQKAKLSAYSATMNGLLAKLKQQEDVVEESPEKGKKLSIFGKFGNAITGPFRYVKNKTEKRSAAEKKEKLDKFDASHKKTSTDQSWFYYFLFLLSLISSY